MLHLVTGLGDAAFLLPASAVLLAYLALSSRPAALVWLSTLALCVGLTVMAKLAFGLGGGDIPHVDIRSPSGHASLSATVYLCAAVMLSSDERPWTRRLLLAGGSALVAAIAASRLLLHAHSSAEILLGLSIGLCCVAWFFFGFRRCLVGSARWHWVAAALIGLAIIAHGRHLGAESLVARLARHLEYSLPNYL